ncbi:4-coumarate--CoA ligase-like 1 [Portunus trituberculatus]|uniref:4-coumarate--CoA ligase-like 1 n=1 Tax=Portunus trituberculatus TaxID=210409 RepID=A0A5B7D0L7_PORTR|nr:4-coumarate--CoA ligase-like 1 [Portunus trituberculatus]
MPSCPGKHITFTPIVPHIIDFLVHTPLLEKYDISSLKSVMSATSPLAASTLQDFKARVNCRVRQGYGLTESCASVTQNHPAFGFKMGSVGRVLPYQEVKRISKRPRNERNWDPVCLRAISVGTKRTAYQRPTATLYPMR